MKKYTNRLYIDIFCSLYGDNFSPKKLQENTNLCLSDTIEVGQIGNYGRYKNKPIPYGSANLRPPFDFDDSENDVLDFLLTQLYQYRNDLKECAVEEMQLWAIYPLEGQKNWSFSVSQIKMMAELNIAVNFTALEREPTTMNEEETLVLHS